MQYVIDASQDLSDHALNIYQSGTRVVMRYYNHHNSNKLPTKRLDKAEADALVEAGLALAVVFQQNGGSKGKISDLTPANGKKDATRALALAAKLGQPKDSAIYFAVDWDYYKSADLRTVNAYFAAVRHGLGGKYRVGVYGSGTVGKSVLDAGHADLAWLAQSTGWSGYDAMLQSQKWALLQGLSKIFPGSGFSYDPNTVNPGNPDFGQFTLDDNAAKLSKSAATSPALLRVVARNGLNLRRGPGGEFSVIATLPYGTLVHGLAKAAPWVKVDIEGDGKVDGFMHEGYLQAVAGGFPLVTPDGATPYQIARQELAAGIAEFPGAADNPRIALYHASTGASDTRDSTPWCSSFVNYCVETSGQIGTDSAWAMSWHDRKWGEDVTKAPQPGDIAVWSRKVKESSGKTRLNGHVGFFVKDAGGRISVLGGNQGNTVSIRSYPKKSAKYNLLSIRRGAL